MKLAKNIILYGPPGTGKTYNTIEYALNILDPKFKGDRQSMKQRFDKYVSEKRVSLVTFHQSYTYEDFIEGIRAETQDGQINYKVTAGIFKKICERAESGRAERRKVFDATVKRLQKMFDNSDGRLILDTVRGRKYTIEYHGDDTFKVFTKESEYNNQSSNEPDFETSLKNVKDIYTKGEKTDRTINSFEKFLLSFMQEELGLKEYDELIEQEKFRVPYVLIIDEINRGNISSIFGELITLIEDSKRSGQSESLSTLLPYSKEKFSVPDNLYIIGTMNTADRSLSMMDTALRRRFDFIEMMPDSSIFEGMYVNGIDIKKLIDTLNERIALLFDRDHTLGHAIFIGIKLASDEDKAFTQLQLAFKNKVFPLLEEYFFEDWNKIRLVLGDNQKQESRFQFVIQEQSEERLAKLLGDEGFELFPEPPLEYRLNQKAFLYPESFIRTYEK
ncbi:McrB family protein [Pleionea sediminis]|uniref:McrB family protein n=1 Tax=Pleionea sediminis TaxID=2569479 RepID=UPI0024826609|nr:AAA family ATPase [Pleionea sediminis]